MNVFAEFDVQVRTNIDGIANLDVQIIASNFVHSDVTFLDVIRAQADENNVPSFFPAA
jgi:hypothetical protein